MLRYISKIFKKFVNPEEDIEKLKEVNEQQGGQQLSQVQSNTEKDIEKLKEVNEQQGGQPLSQVQSNTEKDIEKLKEVNEQQGGQQLSQGQSLLLKICPTHQEYLSLKIQLESKVFLQDMIECILQYTGKAQAKEIATLIYKEDGKANIKTNSLERLYSQCSKLKFSDQKLDKIKFLVKKGKRQAIIRQLISQCGEKIGTQLYQLAQKDIPNIQQKPLPGSLFLKKKNGLQIIKYQSQLCQTDKRKAKNVMVLGQTGSGKSTFLNSLANFLLCVQVDDPFRYYIIEESEVVQTKSITQKITDYYIKDQYNGNVYRLIDTPGFGDTEGVEKDKEIVDLISKKFKYDLEVIHCVLFVMKASNTRVGPYQKYVFDSVMDLFDKSIAPNFAFIFTFSDSGIPSVLEHVQDHKEGFGKYWSQIVEPKFIKVNSCGIFQKIDTKDKMMQGYWQISLQAIKSLFQKINTIQSKSMKLSKDLIYKKQNLLNQINTTYQTIQRSIAKRQNVKKYIEAIINCSKQMDNNKSFVTTVPEQQFQAVTYNGNVTQCRAKDVCMKKNCHVGCSYSNGAQKENCCAMSNGYCTVCGCHWTSHINSDKMYKQITVYVKVTDQTLKDKYEKNKKDKSLSQTALFDKFKQLQSEMNVITVATEQMEKLQKGLEGMQMSNKKPESTLAYVTYLIEDQKKSKRYGYQQKLQTLYKTKDQLELYQNVSKGKYDQKQKLEQSFKQMKSQILKEIKDTVEPTLWQRVKSIFF